MASRARQTVFYSAFGGTSAMHSVTETWRRIMAERGLSVDHTTIYRWVQRYAPELEKRCRPHLKTTNDSWRVDETYVKIKGDWMYLYRAVDSPSGTRWSSS